MKKLKIIFFILFFSSCKITFANEYEELFNADFDELLNLEVNTTSLIYLPYIKSPQAITTISSKDITKTPSRNILDFIENLSPNSMWMSHHDVPHIGIRGMIGDRNNKVLLLVNDRYMNLKAHSGVSSEIDMWDMNDIHKIEIVRGTNSANWGPSAVNGTIKITTKNALNSEGLNIGGIYNPIYNSQGLFISNGIVGENYNLYMYGSIVATKGAEGLTSFQSINNDYYGIIGEGYWQNDKPHAEFADFNYDPQLKLYSELNIGREWKIWSRFVNSGSNSYGLSTKSRQQIGYLPPPNYILYSDNYENFRENKFSHFVFSINNTQTLSEYLTVNSFISYDHQTFARRWAGYDFFPEQDSIELIDPNLVSELRDKNHLRNFTAKFAEQEILLKTIVNYNNLGDFKLAFGGELSYNFFGKPLFGDRTDFRLGDNYNIISGEDSKVFNDFTPRFDHWRNFGGVYSNGGYFVGDGWSSIAFALFSEMNYTFDKFDFLISGRLDKDTYSNYLFSPRFTSMYSFDKSNVIKFTVNHYQRMNIAEQLYVQNVLGAEPSTENIFGLDLSYTYLPNSNTLININAFYNDLDYLGWNESEKATRLIGNLKAVGIELEFDYRYEFLQFGLNHSIFSPLDITNGENVRYNPISYKNYDLNLVNDTVRFKGVGNNINNWSNHITKFKVNVNLFENQLTLGLFGQIFWNYEGANDGIDMIKNGLVTSFNQTQKMANLFSILDKYNVYGRNIRLNANINYTYSDFSFRLAAFNLLNLIGDDYSRRLVYDSGLIFSNSYYRNSFYIEPASFQFTITYNLK